MGHGDGWWDGPTSIPGRFKLMAERHNNSLLTEREGRAQNRGRCSMDRAQRGPYKNDRGPLNIPPVRASKVSK